ncbi:hypothetical protein DPMN_009546 [Dreissena polymorpha]|uniref:Uncharacterized protein n=1 Tax=Dreissena polymorpha TaxID=45954 RepID=A0A9D4N0N4_DREPO|nr:hypothetical protein DPMN_009546 [Dreissena polymorpha]
MNLLTKFHEDWTTNVASRPNKEKCPFPWQPCFSSKDIIGTNLLSKFHEDRKINVASRVLTRKNAPPPGSHVFQPTGIILKLIQYIIETNLLTKFHEDRTINVASRELTRQMLTPHNARRTKTDKRQSQKLTMSTLCSGVHLKDESQQVTEKTDDCNRV